MKVGILTLPLWHNYGGILQAYALRQAVEDIGHEAILIDVRKPSVGRIELCISRLKRTLRRAIRRDAAAPWYPDHDELAQISQKTRRFVQDGIGLRTAHLPVDEVTEAMQGMDAVIVGSDQVWRREYMPDLPTYFLSFPKRHFRKLSYAASLGVESWRFSRSESYLFEQSLRDFQAVSVREDSGIGLLQRELGVKAVRVCDPTLLFNAESYCRVAGVIPRAAGVGGRVFTYVLDSEKASVGALSSLLGHVGGESFSIMPRPFGPGFRREREKYVFPEVEAWLSSFNEADFVVTDSFHGCVFSLIFNRPFVAIANAERGRARFDSLVRRFGLESRLFNSVEDAAANVAMLQPIDWVKVNAIRADERVAGRAFLQSGLAAEPRP